MELWVRSQDKETLIKIENISRDSENYIIGNLISDDNKSICDYWRLGHYKTKERALEVLDEIQNILSIKNSFNLSEEIINKCFKNNTEEEIQKIVKTLAVYEMPEE